MGFGFLQFCFTVQIFSTTTVWFYAVYVIFAIIQKKRTYLHYNIVKNTLCLPDICSALAGVANTK